MHRLKEILKSFIVLALLSFFLISTSGFSFYVHTCSHHETQKILVAEMECCDEDESEPVELMPAGCCAEHSPIINEEAVCHSASDHGNCCTTSRSFYKLSDSFLTAQYDHKVAECPAIELPSVCVDNGEHAADETEFGQLQLFQPPPKTPLYRLFGQIKTDPHLI